MNIYIGNLSYKIREKDLQSVLEEYGTVNSVKVVTDRETGRSKGFGFVEMANDDEANKAIQELNGAELDGRTMVVKVAIPKS
jgi:RNA recognition motif-containing protein